LAQGGYMFKKEFTVQHKSLLSKKDVKQLKSTVLEKFPNLNEEEWNTLFPPEVGIAGHKIDNKIVLYLQQGKPAPSFYHTDDGKGEIYPTLNTLWQFPYMMSELTIHPQVSKFILNGADLMLQGVIPPSNGIVGLGPVVKNQIRCLKVEGNPYPLAVGQMLVNQGAMEKLTGKGLQPLHIFGDALWAHCGKVIPNDGFKEGAEEIEACADTSKLKFSDAEPDGHGGATNGVAHANEEEPKVPDVPTIDITPDDLLEYCFLAACKKANAEGLFPANGSDFYSHVMLPLRPEGTTLDVKKTSHKQISKFYNALRKLKCLEVTEKKGIVTLVSCNLEHKAMKAFEEKYGKIAAESSVVEEKKGKQTTAKQVKVTTLWSPNSDLAILYKEMGIDKKKLMTMEDAMKTVLHAYIEKNDLLQDKKVKIDEKLIDSLYKVSQHKPKDLDEFPKEALCAAVEEIFQNRSDEHTAVEVEGSGTVTKKGPLHKIEVHLTRKGGHNLTRVVGLETFSLSPDTLAQDLKKTLNCTTTVEELPGNKTKEKMLQLQGHVDNELKDYLLSTYGIPKSYVTVKN